MDSDFNIESEITADFAEEFSRNLGNAFIVGDGNEKPLGFINDSRLEQIPTGNASELTFDGIIDLQSALARGQNPSFMMNRRTAGNARKLKDNQGQYLWQPSTQAGEPASLLGDPVLTSAIDMPDVAAGQIPIAYGDWRRGYYVTRGTQMELVRDANTEIDQGIIRYIGFQRWGGAVVLPDAIKLQVVGV